MQCVNHYGKAATIPVREHSCCGHLEFCKFEGIMASKRAMTAMAVKYFMPCSLCLRLLQPLLQCCQPICLKHIFLFFRFPNMKKKPERYRLWVRNCRRDNEPGPSAVVCSEHFPPQQVNKTGQTVRLRPGAVPTLIDLPRHLKKVCN